MEKNKKYGFSMVELSIVMVFIGFLTIAGLVTLNTKLNEYSSPYFNVYNALKKASYNVLADIYCPDSESTDDECKLGPREFPKTSDKLCERLSEFINTAEKNCKDTSLDVNDLANNLDPNKPRFVSTNSYRFYFSDLKKTHAQDLNGNEQELEYFVVYVDLNGRKKPNRLHCEGSMYLPDIIPFAITRRGEVIPMGFPVYSKTYLSAKIKYPNKIDANGNMIDRGSQSLSFYEAVYGAWPKKGTREVKRNINIPFSILITEDGIYKDSLIRQCYNGSEPELRNEQSYKDEAKNKEDEGCLGDTYSCRVIIDSNVETRW